MPTNTKIKEMIANTKIKEMIARLEAPAYWMSGSGEGHEGENTAPVEAAAMLRQLMNKKVEPR